MWRVRWTRFGRRCWWWRTSVGCCPPRRERTRMMTRIPFATWDRTAGVWVTGQPDLFGRSEWFSATWPTSGSTRHGAAFRLPLWAPATHGSGCSWSRLLPTPAASSYGSNQSPSPGASVRPSLETLVPLLPTPQARDGQGRQPGPARLLPTPVARDGAGCGVPGPGYVWTGGGSPPLDETVTNLLLPTPQAADGDRQSLAMVRGNPTLLGALSRGDSTDLLSAAGNGSPDPPLTLWSPDPGEDGTG